MNSELVSRPRSPGNQATLPIRRRADQFRTLDDQLFNFLVALYLGQHLEKRGADLLATGIGVIVILFPVNGDK